MDEYLAQLLSLLQAQETPPRIFREQDAFVNDPSRFLAALCTRRAGKTNALARRFIKTLVKYPGCFCPYIALTRESARNIMWDILKEHADKEKVACVFTESNLTMTLLNGSRLQLFGADMKNFIKRLKGIKTPGAAIDECFHPDTLVTTISGQKRIADIKVGEIVKNAIGWGMVEKVSIKKVDDCRTLEYQGSKIKCSSNHPFLTMEGWKEASQLRKGERLVTSNFSMWLLQQDFSKTKKRRTYLSFLQSELLREIIPAQSQGFSSQQSYETQKYQGQGFQYSQGYGAYAQNQGMEWSCCHCGRTNSIKSVSDSQIEPSGFPWKETDRISNQLQGGFSNGIYQTRNRCWLPQPFIETNAGSEKRIKTCFVRLENNPIQESGSDPRNTESYYYDLTISGHPSFEVNHVIVHNCQDFGPHITDLVDGVLTPTIADYTDGWLALTGTPGPIPLGLFYEITELKKYDYSLHQWSIFQNPYLPDAAAFVTELKKRKGWTDHHPTFQREWLGKWVLDLDALVYKYDEKVNDYRTLPSDLHNDWDYILGIDIGFDDSDAIAVIAWNKKLQECYLVEEFVQSGQVITELAEQIDARIKKYNPLKVVMDTGGLGKKIAEEMRRRYCLPIVAAEKDRKFEFIELLNDAMRMKRFYAKKDSKFVDDSKRIKWDTDSLKPKISEHFHSDICDAVLYAYRESLHWLYEAEVHKPKVGTPQWFIDQEREMEESIFQRIRDEKNIDGFQNESETQGISDDW